MGARDPTDLDERILRAEQALITRENRVKLRAGALKTRVTTAASRPKRWAGPAAGVAAGVLALWWLTRRPGKAAARAARSSGSSDQRRSGGTQTAQHLPLLGIIPALWPLLPERWASRVSPATVTSVASVVLPVVERLFASKPQPPLPTVPLLNLARFAGTWHEIARLPEPFEAFCDGQPSATYTPTPHGRVRVTNVCPKKGGGQRRAHGVARVVPGSGDAKLQVTFLPPWLQWLPFGWADYWVLHIGDDYGVALVGNPARDFLWVLARERRINPAALQAMLALARHLGYDTRKVRITQPATQAS